MKKNIIYLSFSIFLSLLCFSCSSEGTVTTETTTTSSSNNEDKSFTLVYDGKTYTGTRVTFVPNPEPGNPNYKNILSISTTNFSVGIFNIPESGSSTLRSGTYDASKGHCALTLTQDGKALSGGFGGHIIRVSANKLQIDAIHSEKALTGTVEW